MYTKFKQADKIVQDKLDLIIPHIMKNIPGVLSLILFGGYGRGEGAYEKVSNKIRLVNDFDMYVICEKQVDDSILNKVAHECSKMIGAGGMEWPDFFEEGYDFNKFFHVDIHCLSLRRLKYLPPLSRYVDIKKAKVLAGKDLSQLINIDEKSLPVAEGIRILVNRMMAMFLSFKPEFLDRKLSDDEKRALNYYIAKAYISCAESLLIFGREYVVGYELRAKKFNEIYKIKFPDLYAKFPDLGQKVKKFTDYKIVPNPKDVNSLKEWFECQKRIVGVYDYITTKLTNGDKLEKYYYDDYASYVLDKVNLNFLLFRKFLVFLLQGYLSMRYISRLRNEIGKFYIRAFGLRDPGMNIIKATSLVLGSLDNKGGYDQKKLNDALNLIRGVFPVKITELTWEQVKSNYLKAYRTYFLQRFV